jgi:hypothetical protein
MDALDHMSTIRSIRLGLSVVCDLLLVLPCRAEVPHLERQGQRIPLYQYQ